MIATTPKEAGQKRTTKKELWAEIAQLKQELAQAKQRAAGAEFLDNAADKIFELFLEVSENFDGSEYRQGQKDGLRQALSLLRDPSWGNLNRGRGGAGPTNHNPQLKGVEKKDVQ